MANKKVVVREMKADELEKVVYLWQQLHEYEIGIEVLHHELVPDASRRWKRFVTKRLMKCDGKVFVAEDAEGKEKGSGNFVGYCLALIEKNIPIFKLRSYGLISDLFVISEYRSKGISSRLSDKAIEWFKSNELTVADIGTYRLNTHALNVYRHWGFEEDKIGLRKNI